MMDRCSLLVTYRLLALLSLFCNIVRLQHAAVRLATIAYVALQQAHCKRASLQQSNKPCTPWRHKVAMHTQMLLRSLRSIARVRRTSTAAAAAPRCVVELISDTM